MSDAQALPLSKRLFSLLQTLQWAVIVLALFVAALGEKLSHHHSADSARWSIIILALSAFEVLSVIYIRQLKIPAVLEELRRDPEDKLGLIDARKWYGLALAFCGGISLYGFALRVAGTPAVWPVSLYVISVALAFYCNPRPPQ